MSPVTTLRAQVQGEGDRIVAWWTPGQDFDGKVMRLRFYCDCPLSSGATVRRCLGGRQYGPHQSFGAFCDVFRLDRDLLPHPPDATVHGELTFLERLPRPKQLSSFLPKDLAAVVLRYLTRPPGRFELELRTWATLLTPCREGK